MATEVVGERQLTQTFLRGEDVYLRPMTKEDAQRGVAFRASPYPVATDRVEAWITEDLAGEESSDVIVLAIVRTADDVLVGSLRLEKLGFIGFALTPWVHPVFGQRRQAWLGEAIAIASDWLSNERHVPAVMLRLAAADREAIDYLILAGFVVTSRFRERLLVDGARVDEVILQRFNSDWLRTVGNPMEIPLERTGSGVARPAAPRQRDRATAPANAALVGERVYLRPWLEQDAREAILWNRRETDTFHINGRRLPTAEEFIADVANDETEEWLQYVFFTVVESETGNVIGEVGLMHLDYIHRTAETASWFHRPDYRANGFGTEAKNLLLEYAFDTLGLHMVESIVRFENTRSAAALRKQGYREAGRICWTDSRAGTFTSMVTFDLLASEWRALQAPPLRQQEQEQERA